MSQVKAFMEGTTILSSKESTICKILSLIHKQMIWCRMKIKPKNLEVSRLKKEK